MGDVRVVVVINNTDVVFSAEFDLMKRTNLNVCG